MSAFLRAGLVCYGLLGAAWAGVLLEGIVVPWGEVISLYIALPYWIVAYIPGKMIDAVSLISTGYTVIGDSLPPPLGATIEGHSALTTAWKSIVIATGSMLLYAVVLQAVHKWRAMVVQRSKIIYVSLMCGLVVTWIHWFSGFSIDLLRQHWLEVVVDQIAQPIVYVQALIMKQVSMYPPQIIVYSGHWNWNAFVESSCVLSLLTGLLVGSVVTLLSYGRRYMPRILHRHEPANEHVHAK
jgi:hypothetical protein